MSSIPKELSDKLTARAEKLPMSAIMVQELLANDSICRAVASSYDDIERIVLQLMMDEVTEENKDKVSEVVLAHRRTLSILHLFKLKAEATPDRNS